MLCGQRARTTCSKARLCPCKHFRNPWRVPDRRLRSDKSPEELDAGQVQSRLVPVHPLVRQRMSFLGFRKQDVVLVMAPAEMADDGVGFPENEYAAPYGGHSPRRAHCQSVGGVVSSERAPPMSWRTWESPKSPIVHMTGSALLALRREKISRSSGPGPSLCRRPANLGEIGTLNPGPFST